MLDFNEVDIQSGNTKNNIPAIESKSKDIAIIGMAGKLPMADNLEHFWNNLKNGVDCVGVLPAGRKKDAEEFLAFKGMPAEKIQYCEAAYLSEIDKFDYDYFKLSPKEAGLLDPHQRLFLETAWEAIEDAGYGGQKLVGSRTGVFLGYCQLASIYLNIIKEVEPSSTGLALAGNVPAIIASRIGYIMDFKGPSINVDTTCSSSLVALHLACRSLRNGECDYAIAGGVKVLLLPLEEGAKIGIESSDNRTKAFDDSSDGTGTGEGVIALLLKPLDHAVKDRDNIYAVIKGSAVNQDGSSIGITAPNSVAQGEVIVRAWQDAEIDPETISYIEAHGTGTKLGDPIEIDGIERAFRKYTQKKQFCALSALKSNIGHLDGGAGLAGVVKAVLAIKNGIIPPVVHFKMPNRKINFENSPVYVNDLPKVWNTGEFPKRCGVSAFGLSGTNCHVVLEEVVAQNAADHEEASTGYELLTLSAKTEQALNRLIQRYIEFFQSETCPGLRDLCFTANTGRGHYEYRLALIIKDKQAVLESLRKLEGQLPHFQNNGTVFYGRPQNRSMNNGETANRDRRLAKAKIMEIKQGGGTDLNLWREICELYLKGAALDWEDLYGKDNRRRVRLPVYPFERTRCWLEIPERKQFNCEQLLLNDLTHLSDIPADLSREIQQTVAKWKKQLDKEDGSFHSGAKREVTLTGRDSRIYSNLENQVGRVWSEVLGYQELDISGNFYEFGGDSIIAMNIVNQLSAELNVRVEVTDLLRTLNIEKMSAAIDEKLTMTRNNPQKDLSIPKLEEGKSYPVSSAQKRMLITHAMEGANTSYNIFGAYDIKGSLDVAKLEAAVNQVVARHETLRTSFELEKGMPVQRVHQAVKINLIAQDIPKENITAELAGFIRPFDLSRAPLFRVGLFRYERQRYVMIYEMHHIIADGSSMGIFRNEMMRLYNGEKLPPINIQYRDFAAWQNELNKSEAIAKQESYWCNRFSGEIPVLDLPTDFARPASQSFAGAAVAFQLSAAQTARLNQLALETGSTLFMVLLAAYNLLLAKYTGQEDLVVGSPVAGRPHAEVGQLIGMFVNTLAMRNAPLREQTFWDFMGKVRDNTITAFENQDFQFEELVEKLNLPRDLSRNPLFDTMFVFQNFEAEPFEVAGLQITPYPLDSQIANFDLTLQAIATESGLRFILEYCTKLFKKETVERMAAHFQQLINNIIENPKLKLAEIRMMPAAEQQQILNDFNDTQTNYPKQTIPELFEEQAARNPENLALVYEEQQLTYRELNVKANQLAGLLRNKGVTANSIVAIMAERSPKMIIGILGILKAGGAYLPLDPQYPEERIRFMLEDSRAAFLLTQSHLQGVAETQPKVIHLDHKEIDARDGGNLASVNQPDDLAYIIYTSGSAGNPKGVMVEHRNVVRTVKNSNYLEITTEDLILQLSNYAFDGSVFDIFGTLLNGAKLLLINKESILELKKLTGLIRERSVSVFFVTTALFNTLVELDLTCLNHVRKILFGGERVAVKHVRKALSQLGPGKIIHVYGPTESTVYATYHLVAEIEPELTTVPIGKPLSNTKAYIVDKNDNLQVIGAAGELCISGDGLARGYLNRPELTAAKFVPNPFEPGERMYRTGDLARWLPDGNIEFLGRLDHQVKIRGFRIEPGEIESWLLKQKAVQEAMVIAKDDCNGAKYLCAYVVAVQELSITEIREYLRLNLPDYMIPSYFVQLPKLPLNANGKIDWRALPEPVGNAQMGEEYIGPRNEVEAQVQRAWQSVLGVEKIGMNDNFFAIGGNSLKAMQVAAGLEKDFEIAANDIFECQTVASLAQKAVYAKGRLQRRFAALKEMTAAGATTRNPIGEYQKKFSEYMARNDRYQGLNLALHTGYQNILLLGSTGFLGAHLLNQLFKCTDYDIFTIVRGKDRDDAKNRLWKRLDYFFNFDAAKREKLSQRLHIYQGDLTGKAWGLPETLYRELAHKIDAIINAAANVRHFGAYSDFYSINVGSNQTLIMFAQTGKPKDFNLISTLSVGNGMIVNAGPTIFTEYDCELEQTIDNPYVKTKIEAEKLLFKAREAGLNVNVFRVGNLVFDATTGIFQQNIAENAFYKLFKAMLKIKLFPDLKEPNLEFSFIDSAAMAIVRLFDRINLRNETHHICNSKRIRYDLLVALLKELKLDVELVPLDSFLDFLDERSEDAEFKEHIANILIHMPIFDMGHQTEFEVMSQKTEQILSRLDFQWDDPDFGKIALMMEHCRKVNFL
jgi:amino acid adenylation domain-containing protein/thioester reductase-like protein